MIFLLFILIQIETKEYYLSPTSSNSTDCLTPLTACFFSHFFLNKYQTLIDKNITLHYTHHEDYYEINGMFVLFNPYVEKLVMEGNFNRFKYVNESMSIGMFKFHEESVLNDVELNKMIICDFKEPFMIYVNKRNDSKEFKWRFLNVSLINSAMIYFERMAIDEMMFDNFNVANNQDRGEIQITTSGGGKLDLSVVNSEIRGISIFSIYTSNTGNNDVNIEWIRNDVSYSSNIMFQTNGRISANMSYSTFKDNQVSLFELVGKSVIFSCYRTMWFSNALQYSGIYLYATGSLEVYMKENDFFDNLSTGQHFIYYFLDVRYTEEPELYFLTIQHEKNQFLNNNAVIRIIKHIDPLINSSILNDDLMLFTGDVFENNKVKNPKHHYGSSLYFFITGKNNIKMSKCKFHGNEIGDAMGKNPGFGGAISVRTYKKELVKFTVEHSQFSFNRAHMGGVFHFCVPRAEIKFHKCNFYGNLAAAANCSTCQFESGGVIYIEEIEKNSNDHSKPMNMININVSDCLFQDNFAKNAGVMYNELSHLADYLLNVGIYNSTFKKNIAFFSAGALFFQRANVILKECRFRENYCYQKKYSDIESNGGAVYSHRCNIYYYDTSFHKNNAKSNGGSIISHEDELLEIEKCIILNSNSYAGGGIAIYDVERLHIFKDTIIRKCKSSYGAGLLVSQKKAIHGLNELNGDIFDNSAEFAGGGIYFTNELLKTKNVHHNFAKDGQNLVSAPYNFYFNRSNSKKSSDKCILNDDTPRLKTYSCILDSIIFYDRYNTELRTPSYDDMLIIVDFVNSRNVHINTKNTSFIKFKFFSSEYNYGNTKFSLTYLNVTKSVNVLFDNEFLKNNWWKYLLVLIFSIITILLVLTITIIIIIFCCCGEKVGMKKNKTITNADYWRDYVKIEDENNEHIDKQAQKEQLKTESVIIGYDDDDMRDDTEEEKKIFSEIAFDKNDLYQFGQLSLNDN